MAPRTDAHDAPPDDGRDSPASELAAWFDAEPDGYGSTGDAPAGAGRGAARPPGARRGQRETIEERPHHAVAVGKVVASVVILVAGIAAVGGLLQQRGEGGPAGDDAAVAVEQGPDGEPHPVITRPNDPDELVDAARSSRDGLAALPAASDCSNVYADSRAFHEYAALVPTADAWPDLVSARLPSAVLGDIADACDDDYAEQLATYMIDDVQSEDVLVHSLQEHLGRLPQDHPAPPDAAELEGFTALDDALNCTMTGDGVGCSVTDPTFPDPDDCPAPDEDTFSVALFATDVFPCAGTLGDFPDELVGGGSAVFADYACTVEEESVRCWHTVSGTGFELSRDEFMTF